MEDTFTIDVEPGRDLIRIRMSGFFYPEDIAAFVDARQAAYSKLYCQPNQHVTINDIRDMKIQSQEVVAHFHAVLGDPIHRSRRLAFVVASSLARMQLQRALGKRSAACFTDPADVERWLRDEPLADAVVKARVGAPSER